MEGLGYLYVSPQPLIAFGPTDFIEAVGSETGVTFKSGPALRGYSGLPTCTTAISIVKNQLCNLEAAMEYRHCRQRIQD